MPNHSTSKSPTKSKKYKETLTPKNTIPPSDIKLGTSEKQDSPQSYHRSTPSPKPTYHQPIPPIPLSTPANMVPPPLLPQTSQGSNRNRKREPESPCDPTPVKRAKQYSAPYTPTNNMTPSSTIEQNIYAQSAADDSEEQGFSHQTSFATRESRHQESPSTPYRIPPRTPKAPIANRSLTHGSSDLHTPKQKKRSRSASPPQKITQVKRPRTKSLDPENDKTPNNQHPQSDHPDSEKILNKFPLLPRNDPPDKP